MDFAHLVHARLVTVLRSPALHFVLIGVALYLWTADTSAERDGPRVVISPGQVERAQETFVRAYGRPPTAEEQRAFTDGLVEQEVLYRYALQLGLHEQPVVRRRLAQIAEFVAENPDEPSTEAERADRALDLGLQDGDLVVRRILIDGARRLIRAPWLVYEPDDETLKAYLHAHPEPFELPPETTITQISVNRLKHGEHSEELAREIADRLQAGADPSWVAEAFGDELAVSADLPALPDEALARKLGHRFVRALRNLPTGTWSDPIPSIYGLHVVYVHERTPARLPPLSDVRDGVRRRYLQEVADQWLELRVEQLRAEFKVELPESAS